MSNLLINITITIFSFVVRTIFIKVLGEQCLGLDGLFTNILSFLSLAELGFSTSICFCLYEPLAKDDVDKINRLMYFFKNVYKKMACIIFLIGLCLIPFLKYIIKDYAIFENIYLIYILYLINTASSYLTSYSSILIEADQKGYKLTFLKMIFNFLVYGFQIGILLVTKNFLMYLIIQFVFRLVERIIIYEYIAKKYKKYNFKDKSSLNNEEKELIKTNIKGIIFHKVGDYTVNGTDNILISSIVNISMTGLYSNYLSIISVFKGLISSVINAASASFGNLNVLENENIKRNVFNLMNFVCYFFAGLLFIGLYFCFNPFIILWIGESYLLDSICIIVICINFYLSCLLLPINAVKNSVGLYYIDRFIPIIQAVINLFFSILLGIKYGLIGILFGTTISSILTVNITKPYIIYKHVFKTSWLEYLYKIIKNLCIIFFTIIISKFILNYIIIGNYLINFVVTGFISVGVYILICLIMYFKSYEFNYFINLLRKK